MVFVLSCFDLYETLMLELISLVATLCVVKSYLSWVPAVIP